MDLVDKLVHLALKSPGRKLEDQFIICSSCWTVCDLKKHLSAIYPDNPAVEDLRLIYSGQLLRDHMELKDILRQYNVNAVHIIHVVCMPTKCSSTTAHIDGTNETPNQGVLQESATQLEACTSPNVEVMEVQQPVTILDSTGHVTELSYSTYATTCGAATQQMFAIPDMNSPPEQIMEHMLWMHQIYTHFAIQYINYIQSAQPIPFQVPTATTFAGQSPIQPVGPVVNNAQNGQNAHDNDNNAAANGLVLQDHLDYAYLGLTLSIFLAIIFLFSTPSRILSVILMITVLYVCQTDWFRAPLFSQRRNSSPTNDNPENQSEVKGKEATKLRKTQSEKTASALERRETVKKASSRRDIQSLRLQANPAAENVQPNNDTITARPQQVVRDGGNLPVLLTIANFVVGFFASLMPMQPAPIN